MKYRGTLRDGATPTTPTPTPNTAANTGKEPGKIEAIVGGLLFLTMPVALFGLAGYGGYKLITRKKKGKK